MNNKTLFVLGTALFLLLSGCKEERLPMESQSTIPVRVAELKPKSIKEFVTATGTAYAVRDIQLKTEQAGRYRLRASPRTGSPFRMGDAVKKGEVLVSLDNPEYVNQVAFDSKKLQFDSAQREFTKQQSIYEKGGITLRELSDAERMFVDAKYNLENAALSLAKLKIPALFDGVIADLPHFTDGTWIAANTLVVRIVDYSRLYSELALPGKDMSQVARGQKVTVSDYGSSKISLTGEVTQVSPALDPESRMFKLKVEISNPKLDLKPGTFIKADIVVREKDSALVIPKSVILDRSGNRIVYVVDRGVAVERRIRTGIENKDEAEIIEGLRPGDRLIIEGFETLRNRTQVKVIQ